MRIRRLLISLFLLMTVLGAGYSVQAATLDSQELEAIFSETVLKNAPWSSKDLEISGFKASPEALFMPEGKVVYRIGNRQNSSHLGRKIVLLQVTVDGRDVGQIKMTGDLRLFGDVICVTRKIARNSIVGAEDIKLVRRDISMLDSDLVSEKYQVVGKRLKTSLRAGAVVYGKQLAEPPLVKRGDFVTIMARSGPMMIKTQGEVKGTGALGDLVRVKNMMSRREVYAKVLDVGLVEVTF